jgi:glyoxylase-like metal-dependent hydrolase (beta-lactamase superfamily II)
MLIESVVAEYFGTNCWVVAPARNSECIIVDPGITAPSILARVREVTNKFNLKPVAVILTHGHLDHMFSVVPVADGYGIPAMIHTRDRALISNPMKALTPGGPSEQIIKQFGSSTFTEPAEVVEFLGNESVKMAGLSVEVRHAPGHTAGSAIFVVDGEYLIAGDVLFEGSIGRTDLPTGSARDMKATLRNQILTLDDQLIVLPGHGSQTTIARERKKNPYLQSSFLDSKEAGDR